MLAAVMVKLLGLKPGQKSCLSPILLKIFIILWLTNLRWVDRVAVIDKGEEGDGKDGKLVLVKGLAHLMSPGTAS